MDKNFDLLLRIWLFIPRIFLITLNVIYNKPRYIGDLIFQEFFLFLFIFFKQTHLSF